MGDVTPGSEHAHDRLRSMPSPGTRDAPCEVCGAPVGYQHDEIAHMARPSGRSGTPVMGQTDLRDVACRECGGPFRVASYVLARFWYHGCPHCKRAVRVDAR